MHWHELLAVAGQASTVAEPVAEPEAEALQYSAVVDWALHSDSGVQPDWNQVELAFLRSGRCLVVGSGLLP